MKASKLVLTIFFGFIFTVVAYLCFYMLSSNHDRGVKDEVHYVPFEVPFKHLVVEDGWRLSAFIGDDPVLFDDLHWFTTDSVKIKEVEAKLASDGMLMTQYYPVYDDKELLSRIEIKNDTLFFRKVKRITSSIRTIRLNLVGLSSVKVSGKSSVSMYSKKRYTEKNYSDEKSFNLGRFTINTSDQSSASANRLVFDQLTVRSQDFSQVSLEYMFLNFPQGIKEVPLNSDVELSDNATLRIRQKEILLTKYKISDEAVIHYPNKSIETVYGKKDSRYLIELNKQTNASSTSSN
ncbi:hypothetical protein OB69_01860 [Roseivirga seohaensis subsp. aquiponti]|uniref:Uncharacterized protein n=1 Tax=Roseivirga seohaensis subsp. aquiponti TaxID=1566026 RepID=A0A0L8APX3_9BACT|nr:hypothetical protein [Roseivirga seohaensis]KOF04291.1 hypothetical protein OB69_01860 [Roseivirga seohaensis subsp. aquiponti]